jgi:PII-like signaling protein
MKTEGQAHLLRIFVNESDRWEGRPLYEMIIRAAKEKGLAGATALRGMEGYGASGRVHSVKVLHLSEDVPIVVEIMDSAERIAVFLPVLDKMVAEGAVTIEKVHLMQYRRDIEPAAELTIDDEIQLDVEVAVPAVANFPRSEASDGLEMTDRAHQIVIAARESAADSRRVYVDSVDVLLAMLIEPRGMAENALRHLGMDIRLVKRALQETVSRDERTGAYLKAFTAKSTEAAKWLEDEYIGAEHLLLALCQIRPSAATDILTRMGAQPRDICQEVLNTIGHDGDWQRWLADHPEL